jgi:hypothetical protein
MKHTLRPAAAVAAVVAAIMILLSCGPATNAPEKGTPAFYWAAAKETFATADYAKTSEHLDKLITAESEYTRKAQVWMLVLTAGLSRGYEELAQNYEYGARANRADPTPFRKQMSQARTMAGRQALQFAEVFAKFQTSKEENVALEFPFPTGSATPVPQISKVAKGMPLPPAEAEQVHQRVLQRGVLLVLCKAAGAPEDTAKLQEMFKAGAPKVPRGVFLLGMAGELYDQSQLYTGQKLDDPRMLELLCTRAQEVLKALPESKASKALGVKVQAALKKKKDR